MLWKCRQQKICLLRFLFWSSLFITNTTLFKLHGDSGTWKLPKYNIHMQGQSTGLHNTCKLPIWNDWVEEKDVQGSQQTISKNKKRGKKKTNKQHATLKKKIFFKQNFEFLEIGAPVSCSSWLCFASLPSQWRLQFLPPHTLTAHRFFYFDFHCAFFLEELLFSSNKTA